MYSVGYAFGVVKRKNPITTWRISMLKITARQVVAFGVLGYLAYALHVNWKGTLEVVGFILGFLVVLTILMSAMVGYWPWEEE